jgi:hypothetical protein
VIDKTLARVGIKVKQLLTIKEKKIRILHSGSWQVLQKNDNLAKLASLRQHQQPAADHIKNVKTLFLHRLK